MTKSHAPRASRVVAALVLSVVLMAAGCQPSPGGSGSNPALDYVDPHLTDPGIPTDTEHPQFSILPATSPRNRLAVLFNGTASPPASLYVMARALASDGYHVIGLRYESGLGTLNACPPNVGILDPDCHRRLRSEVVYGENVPPTPTEGGHDHLAVTVTADTSVVNRLLAYVEYLKVNSPEAGWGQYQQLDSEGGCALTNAVYQKCELHWDEVVAMGYSQGAGIALYLGKHLELGRIGMLAGPFDAFGSFPNYVAAPWLGEPFATDTADMAALVHDEDSNVDRQRAALNAVGLVEAEVDVTWVEPPYWNSRRLVTTAKPQCVFPSDLWAHSAPMGGGCTEPGLHADAWRYLAAGPQPAGE